MGIHITCDFCGKSLDFGGDWRRVKGGGVACVSCQELVNFLETMRGIRRNLDLFQEAQMNLGQEITMVDDAIILHKSLTNTLQQLLLIKGDEF